jgi:drug/metabolite transporter (DMT)-like permease
MTLLALSLCIASQLCLVGGQVFLKRAMNATSAWPSSRGIIWSSLTATLLLFTTWFFLWIGLLAEWDLSRLYPFESLGPPLVVIAAWYFLGERVAPHTWIGIALIAAGVGLIAAD